MEDLVAAGHEVFALGSDNDGSYTEMFAARGIKYGFFRVSRNGLSPLEDLRTYLDLRRIIGAIRPDRVFVYQAKTIVYGCPAAIRCGATGLFPLVAGLGSVFRGGGVKNRIIQGVLKLQYRLAFNASTRVFFQNPDDRDELVSLGLLPAKKTVMINGSGVDLDRFTAEPLPATLTFLFVGRLIRDKGVIEYLEACRVIRTRHPEVRCLLVGPYDTNPSALRAEDLASYVDSGAVEYLGEKEDVREAIASSSVFVLPSYHEGTPKSVLEAMSMGRAIITTDAPGCRETVDIGTNGILVGVRDVEALVAAMEQFLRNPALAGEMGVASRRIAEDKYDVHKVNGVIMQTMGLLGNQARQATSDERGE